MSDYLYFRKELQPRVKKPEIMAILHEYLRNVLTLPPDKIIQQWQRNPPVMDMAQDWLSFGVSSRASTWQTYQQNNELLDIKRYQDLTVNLIFYGDECESNAEMLKDSFIHADNQAFFNKNSMIQVDFGSILTMPELIDQQWINRCDCSFRLRHLTTNQFDMPTILEANINLNKE